MSENNKKHEHVIGYGTYVAVWLTLLALTAITVSVAGIDLGIFTLAVALLIAGIKSLLVINIFMHIKYDDILFKLFFLLTAATLIIALLGTAVDIFLLRGV
ncbi:MAG TPA: cytochrome C oxidase subunit IV family protein [Ignavibacteriales bacterium]|jgi:cytochrome c oxidase subunit 4|nr:cytochrome C oxidase subunit IV family protein [Ignavibacteriales bacterium]HEX3074618.1 cytochrome C oxidase subunit IV family protein [Ignavibacteriales bacterium]